MTQPGTSVSPSNSPRATRPLHRSAILVLAAIMMVLVGVTTEYEASTGALPSSNSSPADSAGPGYATNAGYVTNVSTISRPGNLLVSPAYPLGPCSFSQVYGNCASSDPVLTYRGGSPYGPCATSTVTIDWNDGNKPETIRETSSVAHRYLAARLYHVTLTSPCMLPSSFDFTYTR
jgi:hypothetical protein